MSGLILGATAFGFITLGFFFLRYWTQTKDRFFLFFALGFFAFALNRVTLGLTDPANENRYLLYLIRLAATLLILFAIVDKNRGGSSTGDEAS